MRLTQVYANRSVALNAQTEIRAGLLAMGFAGQNVEISLREGGRTLQTQSVRLAADKFDKSIGFSLVPAGAGLHHYILVASILEGETNHSNNRRDVYINVTEQQQTILLAAAAPHPDIAALRSALSGLEQYKLTVSNSSVLPPDAAKYDVIILHQFPTGGAELPAALLSKPIWYIAGRLSNISTLGKQNLPVMSGLQQTPGANMLPVANTAFSLFTLPAGLANITSKLPPLLVLTAG